MAKKRSNAERDRLAKKIGCGMQIAFWLLMMTVILLYHYGYITF